MIEHRHRFHGHGSIVNVYKHGQTVRARYISLRFQKNPNRLHSRCAVVVSKKIFKAAVKRNLIRRRIYESLRRMWPDLSQSFDLVFTVFDSQIISLSPLELDAQLKHLMRQSELVIQQNKP